MLIFCRDREVGENDDEDEDVIDGKRFLDDVAGEEFERGLIREDGRLRSGEAGGEETGVLGEFPLGILPKAQTEKQGEADPYDGPREGLLKFYLVGFAVEDAEVEGKHAQNEEREEPVEPPIVGEREENG
eukprot:gene13404-biopygen11324